jgi:hypothetical protein
MAGRITLNQVYRAINHALGIDRPRQFEILQGVTRPPNKSMVSGFSKPVGDNRHRHVTHRLLMEYCVALASQSDLAGTPIVTELQKVAQTLENGDMLDESAIDHWEGISEERGNGPIWQALMDSDRKRR